MKFAIIGCGRIGERHAKQIANAGRLLATCDVIEERSTRLAESYGARSFADIDQLLKEVEDIDVVSVCTPNGLHAIHTIKALNNGHHVLCEKPMAISVYDCGEMIKSAEKANRRLFIVKQNRFNPVVAAVKKILDAGKLGRVLSAQLNCFWNRNEDYYESSDWKGTKSLDGGTLYTQFSHFIDLIYWMLGDVSDVTAFVDNSAHGDLIEFEDSGVIALRFYSGVLATINYNVNSYRRNMEGSLTLFGEKGTVKIGGQYLNELDYQCIEDFEIGELRAGNPANEYGNYQGSMSNHDKVYENVVEVLNNGGEIATNGFEGLKTVEIIDKIYRAAGRV